MADKKRSKDDSPPAAPPAGAPEGAGRPDRPDCTVVGIGASAGGVEALQQFFAAVPADCGLSFVVVVQAPETAGHGGMPRNAIATGAIDHVLPVAEMPAVLVDYARHPYAGGGPCDDGGTDHLTGILALVRARTRRDFRRYKRSTLRR